MQVGSSACKLRARFFLVAEHAKHCRCNSGGMLLFHSAHHHAEMAGFNYHAHSLWLNDFLDGLGKLRVSRSFFRT